jgi:hypothetical protein
MTQLMLQWKPTATTDPCGLCGQPAQAAVGTQLVVADTLQPVCSECGRRNAPSLAALVQLATEAERVGRIGRHTIFPPYTALLDLARAADNYSAAVPSGCREAN